MSEPGEIACARMPLGPSPTAISRLNKTPKGALIPASPFSLASASTVT